MGALAGALSVNRMFGKMMQLHQSIQDGRPFFTAAEDHGFMYQHSFLDPDGHGWNLFYMSEKP